MSMVNLGLTICLDSVLRQNISKLLMTLKMRSRTPNIARVIALSKGPICVSLIILDLIVFVLKVIQMHSKSPLLSSFLPRESGKVPVKLN